MPRPIPRSPSGAVTSRRDGRASRISSIAGGGAVLAVEALIVGALVVGAWLVAVVALAVS